MMAAVIYTFPDNNRYKRAEAEAKAKGEIGAAPEARLPPALVGSIFLPIGLFIFTWTNYPSVHFNVSTVFTAPFGFGMVLVFLSIMNYLIDAYTMYAASVLAAKSVLRSTLGTVFPLFTTYMYDGLGIHWASSIPAFLALACVPFLFLFYKYRPTIRKKCKFAREAAEMMAKLKSRPGNAYEEAEESDESDFDGHDRDPEKEEPTMQPEGVEGARIDTTRHGLEREAKRTDPERDVRRPRCDGMIFLSCNHSYDLFSLAIRALLAFLRKGGSVGAVSFNSQQW